MSSSASDSDGDSGVSIDTSPYDDPSKIPWLPPNLPRPKVMKRTEVKAEARKHAHAIFASWKQLNSILQSHETVIQRRWRSKSRTKRTGLLLKAWPQMPASHRPDFEAFLKESSEQRKSNPQLTDHYLFPFINLHDLAKERPLLILLNSRGRHMPDEFAVADGELFTFGRKACTVIPGFLNGYVMLFRGCKTPESYGKLISWEDHPDAFWWSHTRQELMPGDGLLVLAIQERLLAFLVEVARLILHDIDLSIAYPPLPDPGVAASKQTLSTLDQSIENAYRLPSAINFDTLETLVFARLKASQAHFVALREDPAYFAATMNEHKEHRRELLCDAQGRPHPLWCNQSNGVFWERVLGEVIIGAHIGLESWELVYEQLLNARRIHARYAARLDTSKPLPDDLLLAFLQLQHSLNQLEKGAVGVLKASFCPSPPVRQWFERLPPPTPGSTVIGSVSKGAFHQDPTRPRVMYLLDAMWDDDKKFSLCGIEFLMDVLDSYLEREPSARALLSPHIVAIISDLGLIAEAKRQISLFQPWAAGFEHDMLDGEPSKEETIMQQFAKRMLGLQAMVDHATSPALVQKALPLGEKFAYPSHKRRTKDVTDVLRRSEANLDALWAAVDAIIVPLVDRHTQLVGLRQFIGSEGRLDLDRTPEWQPLPARATSSKPPSSSTAAFDLSEYYRGFEDRSRTGAEETEAGPAVTKQKSRGTAHGLQQGESQPSTSLPPTPEAPSATYVVSRKALKTFRTLFHNPDEASHPGDIPWIDIVEALKQTGLDPQQMAGSAVKFSPIANHPHLRTSIMFHQPHPSPNVPYRIAREHGRQLRRRYGWDAGTFVEKNQASETSLA